MAQYAQVITPEDLQTKQVDLSTVVEPLVDSISELVLNGVTGALEHVEENCLAIADRTNKLVVIASQVASSSTDEQLQLEVANSLNDVAKSIEQLVLAFNGIIIKSTSQTQEAFAAAAKNVGEAINQLCVATDQTSARKIMQAIKEALESAREVRDAALNDKNRLLTAAQNNVEKTVKVVKVVTLAAGSTADEKKKQTLLDGATKVKNGSPLLIQSARALSEKPFDTAAKADLDEKAKYLSDAFNAIVEASKANPQYFGKAAITYEYVKKLIEKAKDLENAAASLYAIATSPNGSVEDFVAKAKEAGNKALQLIQHAEQVLSQENLPPVKKVIVRDAIQQLRDASQQMILAGRKLKENPNDPVARENFDRAHARLQAAIKNIVQATSGSAQSKDLSPEGRLATSALALQLASRQILDDAKDGRDVTEGLSLLKGVALQLATDAEIVANRIADPSQRAKLLADIAEVKKAVERYETAVLKYKADPSEKNRREMEEAHNHLMAKLNMLKKNANLSANALDEFFVDIQPEPPAPVEVTVMDTSSSSDGNQLVTAAKDQAKAAMQLASEADALADKITDPIKRQKIKDAVKEAKLLSQKVVEMAELVSKNPHDPIAQQKLTAVQKELGAALEKIVDLTSNSKNADIFSSIQQMKEHTDSKLAADEHAIVTSAQALLDEMGSLFNPDKKMTPAEVVAASKQLSTKASELAKQLLDMAAKTSDPVFKQKLITSARLIKDVTIQIKILSAVRAAGGEDKTNTVQNAIKTLQQNIHGAINDVTAESLRTKFRNTVKQTVAINNLLTNWRKQATTK